MNRRTFCKERRISKSHGSLLNLFLTLTHLVSRDTMKQACPARLQDMKEKSWIIRKIEQVTNTIKFLIIKKFSAWRNDQMMMIIIIFINKTTTVCLFLKFLRFTSMSREINKKGKNKSLRYDVYEVCKFIYLYIFFSFHIIVTVVEIQKWILEK